MEPLPENTIAKYGVDDVDLSYKVSPMAKGPEKTGTTGVMGVGKLITTDAPSGPPILILGEPYRNGKSGVLSVLIDR